MEDDAYWMRRAIRLAMNGRGRVEPNPMVGCVIVKQGRVIGEGYHPQFGGPHAEPNALAACTESPEGATVYVTLEPCCHTDKKTPPCVPRLIRAQVGRVVIGCVDPDPGVNGKGIAQLRAAGIDVAGAVLEGESKQLLAPFIAQVKHRRPYVTLKWAETADHRVAGPGGRRIQISSLPSARQVHLLRSRSDAILVGRRTLVNDDPTLTARDVPQLRPLTRIVLMRRLDLSPTSQLLCTHANGPIILCCSQESYQRDGRSFLALLSGYGISLLPLPEGPDGDLSLSHLVEALGRTEITHLLVEPGPITAGGFFRQNLADRVWVFRSPDRLNDETAPRAAAVPFQVTAEAACGRDALTEYLNTASPVFFAPEPSADFVLAATSTAPAGGR